MKVSISITKDVADKSEAQAFVDQLKEKFGLSQVRAVVIDDLKTDVEAQQSKPNQIE
jgi:hypothetical protein